MKYLAVLGRQVGISLAEIEAQFGEKIEVAEGLAQFESKTQPEIDRLGGTLKIAEKLAVAPLEYLQNLPEGKITLGISDYSERAVAKEVQQEALRLKKILTRHGRSVRVLPNKTAALSTATSHHNQIGKHNHIELIRQGKEWWRVIGVQNITAYAQRDQARPARDAKVGMLPPKLAQILINLGGKLANGARILDPFCGTGVVLQEAALMGYRVYGTDINERMVKFSKKNLGWLGVKEFEVAVGDATTLQWPKPIDAVICETYLGKPMSLPPAEVKLKAEKQECRAIILGFLKNLGKQIKTDTPVVIAIPAWLRPNHNYERLDILDEIEGLGYNLVRFKNVSQEDLLYHREGQVVAREIIVLRKK